MEHTAPKLEPAIIVIFGITGDLAKRKLLPALYHLVKNDLLHDKTEIIGVTRGQMSMNELLATIELCVNEKDGICDPVAVQKLKKKLRLRKMEVTKSSEYESLLEELNAIEDSFKVCMNRLFYLSIPPNVSQPIISFLGKHGLNKSCQHNKAKSRLLSEKPFGYDYKSSQELMDETKKYFKEDQIFRIDHYLAKETVQNILSFRFSNPIFQPLWNSKHIDYIEVMANEKIGIEGRVKFYEQIGALRDLIQSHLLQVLALVAMEQPDENSSESLHQSKVKLMAEIQAVPPNKVVADSVRGQYDTYLQEVDNSKSNTETYAALRLQITNKRWAGVPFIVRTGKGLSEKSTKIRIVFKPTDLAPHHNILTFRLQPDEGIELSLRVKKPGYSTEIQPAEMDFSYKRTFNAEGHPDAYERVLVDAVRGDHTLFATSDEVMQSWRIVQPVLNEWSKASDGLNAYSSGSQGPKLPESWKIL
ncbi:glucose-6-phosphate dehydrogenase [Candidatus Saccharibacteria bacterium]|nr:glucose-6-phosphate dehydrogenase [Candidatus Saccharibacteria bacterium]